MFNDLYYSLHDKSKSDDVFEDQHNSFITIFQYTESVDSEDDLFTGFYPVKENPLTALRRLYRLKLDPVPRNTPVDSVRLRLVNSNMDHVIIYCAFSNNRSRVRPDDFTLVLTIDRRDEDQEFQLMEKDILYRYFVNFIIRSKTGYLNIALEYFMEAENTGFTGQFLLEVNNHTNVFDLDDCFVYASNRP
jgi:hypothetical protein